jgi:surface protein
MSFIFKITTTTSPQNFTIPCHNDGTFNATVDYGDGTGSQTVTAYNDSNLTHSFATAGQYTITIDGTFPNIRFSNNATSAALVDEVVDLGDVGWLMLYSGFEDCTNLTSFSAGTANTVNNTYAQMMFRNCTSLTSVDLTNFDTSNVTSLNRMFQDCSSLTTLDLSSFDTSNVTQTFLMFYQCLNLTTLDVSSFDTSSVTTMQLMFYHTNLTDLDIKHFDVSSVTNASDFLNRSNNALTTAAYDELLEAWAVQDVQPNVPWHFGDAQYTVLDIEEWVSLNDSGGAWSISNGSANVNATSNSYFENSGSPAVIKAGSKYLVSYEIKNYISGSVRARVGGGIGTSRTANGIYSQIIGGAETYGFNFECSFTYGFNGSVDNVSVKEITNYSAANVASDIEYSQENVFGSELVANGNFATDADWDAVINATVTATNNTLEVTTTSQASGAYQNISTNAGAVYTFTATASSFVSGALIRVTDGTAPAAGFAESQVVDGTAVLTFTAVGSITNVYLRNTVAGTSVWTSASVKEITNAVEYQSIGYLQLR